MNWAKNKKNSFIRWINLKKITLIRFLNKNLFWIKFVNIFTFSIDFCKKIEDFIFKYFLQKGLKQFISSIWSKLICAIIIITIVAGSICTNGIRANPYFYFFFINIAGLIGITLSPKKEDSPIIMLVLSLSAFWIARTMFLNFDLKKQHLLQFHKTFSEGNEFIFAVDTVSMSLLLLTTFIITICVFLLVWEVCECIIPNKRKKAEERFSTKTRFLIKRKIIEYYEKEATLKIKIGCVCLLIIQFVLCFLFTTQNILHFFIAFESILAPILTIINIWGSRVEKKKAIYTTIGYALLGSIPMLLAITYIWHITGTLNWIFIKNISFNTTVEYWLFFAFFISFAVKVPMIPLHLWLPQAHVEASTIGSVILAALLLKVGIYGLYKFNILLFPKTAYKCRTLIHLFSTIPLLGVTFTLFRLKDLKKIIAYSSILHMNIAVISLFTFEPEGPAGCFLSMITHGLVSTGLFIIVGALYGRTKTRNIDNLGGLNIWMPVLSTYFLLFILANNAFPGTGSFVAEILMFSSMYASNKSLTFIIIITFITGSFFNFWCTVNIIWGNINKYMVNPKGFLKGGDLNFAENYCLALLFFLIIAVGLSPNLFLTFFNEISLYIVTIKN